MNITIAPGGVSSVNQSGGITAGTVNVGSIQRHIKNRTAVISYLSRMSGAVRLSTPWNDGAAGKYAEEWRAAFEAAGWKIAGFTYAMLDRSPQGIFVTMHGDAPSQGEGRFSVDSNEPAFYVAGAINSEGIPLNGHREPSVPVGEVDIWIGSNSE